MVRVMPDVLGQLLELIHVLVLEHICISGPQRRHPLLDDGLDGDDALAGVVPPLDVAFKDGHIFQEGEDLDTFLDVIGTDPRV